MLKTLIDLTIDHYNKNVMMTMEINIHVTKRSLAFNIEITHVCRKELVVVVQRPFNLYGYPGPIPVCVKGGRFW